MSKRPLDLVVGIPATLLALPILAVTGLAVLLTSGWPVFLVQERVGARERPIHVIKLRTMRVGVPVVAKALLDSTQARYTPLGPFLRRTSLDELPQLLNVLHGSMSLVGPRPALPTQHDLLALRRRNGSVALKPGLTGLAQVLGRESLTLSTKARCDGLYARRRSLWLDLGILVWTIRALTGGRGAY